MTDEASFSDIRAQAQLWAIRAGDDAFADWDGLSAWLEADAGHLAAYEDALAQEEWVDALFAARPADHAGYAEFVSAPGPVEHANDEPARRRRWPAWGAGLAAAAVAAVAGWAVIDRGPGIEEVITAPGEHRSVEFADGSRILLNGDTRISYTPDKPREVTLAQGEVLFEVRHDERNPFIVTAGDTRLVDAGTVFNVVRDRDDLDVAVAEGEVIYKPGKSEIRLLPGDALSRSGSRGQPVLRKANLLAIGGWRSGRLEFDNASIANVARDLGRNIGRPVVPADNLKGVRFTGTLMVEGNAQDVLLRVGPLLGVSFVPEGGYWRMTPADAQP